MRFLAVFFVYAGATLALHLCWQTVLVPVFYLPEVGGGELFTAIVFTRLFSTLAKQVANWSQPEEFPLFQVITEGLVVLSLVALNLWVFPAM